MATDYTAADVMDGAASLLNDTARSVYSYTVQLPYLNMAIQELQETFQLNNIPVTDINSAVINVPSGTSEITFGGSPALPSDLIDIQKAWQRQEGIDPYIPLSRLHAIPLELSGVETTQLYGYTWQSQKMQFLPANTDIDIKLEYIRELFAPLTASDDEINIINAKTFLQNRTAALMAQYVEENPDRAGTLNANAGMALDTSVGISAKGLQGMVTRRKPFRSGYKVRGW
jgi:hypothetical protein